MPGVLRNTLKPFGKARQKCIEMLEEIGIRVDMCYPAVGHWRTSIYADVYRWEFSGTLDGVTVCGGCWETMTKCARVGKLEYCSDRGEVWPVARVALSAPASKEHARRYGSRDARWK